MQSQAPLLIDTEEETLVDLPSGRLSKNGTRKAIKVQKPLCCSLFALRRISFFEPSVDNKFLYNKFEKIKSSLYLFNDVMMLCESLKQICESVSINHNEVIFNDNHHALLDKILQPKVQIAILLEALIKQKLFILFNLQDSNWHPRDGFEGLKKSLKQFGAHVFVGRFGACFHGRTPEERNDNLLNMSCYNSHNRKVLGFKPGSYLDNYASAWTHSIVVDQVKVYKEKQFIFFRDPYKSSDPSEPELIFMLSYLNFIDRLTNFHSQRYSQGKCPDEKTFGIVSKDPKRLLMK